MTAPMTAHLVTPERELWSGPAVSVVAPAFDGELGVLPGHVPLFTPMGLGAVVIHPEGDGEPVRAAVDNGFLHVVTTDGATRVDILAEHADLAGQIDQDSIDQLRAEADRLQQAGDPDAARTARAGAQLRERLLRGDEAEQS